MRSGRYWLWTIGDTGYIQAGRIVGQISANRTNVGSASKPLLDSGLAADGAYLSVRWGSDGSGNGRLPAVPGEPSGDVVRGQHAELENGEASADLRMRRPGVAVLSASYDPGWTATVNGRAQPTRMVTPALVAVNVPAGTDDVVFGFHGYRDYPVLLALSGIVLAIIALAPMYLRRANRRRAFTGARTRGLDALGSQPVPADTPQPGPSGLVDIVADSREQPFEIRVS
jgi:hypothetical protein